MLAHSLLIAAGAEAHRGDLENLDSLRSGSAKSDAVIHTAFNHDFSKYVANCEADRQAIEALGDASDGRRQAADCHVRDWDGEFGGRRSCYRARCRRQFESGSSGGFGRGGCCGRGARGSHRHRAAASGPRHGEAGPGHVCNPRRARKGSFGVRGRRTQPLARGCTASIPRGSTGWRSRRRAPATSFTLSRKRECPCERSLRLLDEALKCLWSRFRPKRLRNISAGSRRLLDAMSQHRARTRGKSWDRNPTGPGLIPDLEHMRYSPA